MGESPFLSHEEYELMKVPLEHSEVPADALAMLTAWIEREHLLVDDRENVGGISFSRIDARAVAPLPHVIASFFAHNFSELTSPLSPTSTTGDWRPVHISDKEQ